MSSRPEAGEREAREDDGLDFQHDYEAGEETEAASQQSNVEGDPVPNDTALEDGTSTSTDSIAQRKTGIASLDSPQASKPQDSSVQLLEDTHSADDTSSLPDDTPSVQVNINLVHLLVITHNARVPSCLPSRAMSSRFEPRALMLAQPHPEDHSIDASSLVYRHPL
jgi:hypothetical protein